MAYPSASIPTELQTATFIDFLYRARDIFIIFMMVQTLFPEPEMGTPDEKSLKLITDEIN